MNVWLGHLGFSRLSSDKSFRVAYSYRTLNCFDKHPNTTCFKLGVKNSSLAFPTYTKVDPVSWTGLGSTLQCIWVEDQKRFQIACNRQSSGMTRHASEDERIDFMGGLEALFLPDGSQELALRLSLRVARMLEQDTPTQRDLFEFTTGMYDSRSRIVHCEAGLSKKFQLTDENVSRLEETLRKSLKRWLADSAPLSKARLSSCINWFQSIPIMGT